MVPIHFESYYRVGGDDKRRPRRELIAETGQRGLQGRVFALYTGERIVLPDGESSPFVLRETAVHERVAAEP